MAPKVKTTKEDIVNAAVELVRKNGDGAINARNVASLLNCSTQPIFSNFATMEELRLAVLEKTDVIFSNYIKKEIESGKYPSYKASGMAYIRFAKEEKELFKLLYMRDRRNERNAVSSSETENLIGNIVHDTTGLVGDKAQLFHLEMWMYVHGIATVVATEFENLSIDLISSMITDAYQGLKKQFGLE